MSTLAEDFAAVLTDIGRTPDSNDDPMRWPRTHWAWRQPWNNAPDFDGRCPDKITKESRPA